jgi:hypothetical protein
VVLVSIDVVVLHRGCTEDEVTSALRILVMKPKYRGLRNVLAFNKETQIDIGKMSSEGAIDRNRLFGYEVNLSRLVSHIVVVVRTNEDRPSLLLKLANDLAVKGIAAALNDCLSIFLHLVHISSLVAYVAFSRGTGWRGLCTAQTVIDRTVGYNAWLATILPVLTHHLPVFLEVSMEKMKHIVKCDTLAEDELSLLHGEIL